MRRILLALILLLTLPGTVLAAPSLGGLPTGQLNSYLQEVNQESRGYLPTLSIGSVVQAVRKGGLGLGLRELATGFGRYLFSEVLSDTRLLGQLVVLAVLAAVLENLGRTWESDQVARLGSLVVYLALLVLVVQSFGLSLGLARATVERLSGFVTALLPVLIPLLAGMGAVSSAAILHPLLLFAVSAVSLLVKNLVFPLLYLGAVVDLVGQATRYQLSGVAGLLKQSGIWALGLFLALFIGVTTIIGSVAPVADGLTLRTGKFLANAFIPVVGKMFADAAELVLGSSLLLKNAVTVAGLLAVLILAAFPLLKILSMVFIYRLAAGLVAPLGAGPLATALGSLAGTLTLLLVALGAVALMFFLAMTMVLSWGSAAALPI